jgi:glucosamine 6-phosphate synthetase-like amidotransferase/phosphosugar isomerase protein
MQFRAFLMAIAGLLTVTAAASTSLRGPEALGVARGARTVLLADAVGIEQLGPFAMAAMDIPISSSIALPLLYSIPVQRLAYDALLSLGRDKEQPRNLVKSVTVE